ncbi:MAG: hypothetical protein GVY16_11940 [Planctomycetes bacterium]|nr:hypothetical protein [Planctomycetota bacterium]
MKEKVSVSGGRMAQPKIISLTACLVLAWTAAARAGDITGYEAIVNWSDLPRAKTGMTSHLASSYDRTGANEDWNWYEGYDRQLNTLADNNLPVTLLDVAGSGVLTRYWMPHATANDTRPLTITVDAGLPTEAVISTSTDPFLYGGDGSPYSDLFEGDLVATTAGGQTSYEPIGFTSSLKVETINRTHIVGQLNGWSDRHYYQLNYTLSMMTPTVFSLTPARLHPAILGRRSGSRQSMPWATWGRILRARP